MHDRVRSPVVIEGGRHTDLRIPLLTEPEPEHERDSSRSKVLADAREYRPAHKAALASKVRETRPISASSGASRVRTAAFAPAPGLTPNPAAMLALAAAKKRSAAVASLSAMGRPQSAPPAPAPPAPPAPMPRAPSAPVASPGIATGRDSGITLKSSLEPQTDLTRMSSIDLATIQAAGMVYQQSSTGSGMVASGVKSLSAASLPFTPFAGAPGALTASTSSSVGQIAAFGSSKKLIGGSAPFATPTPVTPVTSMSALRQRTRTSTSSHLLSASIGTDLLSPLSSATAMRSPLSSFPNYYGGTSTAVSSLASSSAAAAAPITRTGAFGSGTVAPDALRNTSLKGAALEKFMFGRRRLIDLPPPVNYYDDDVCYAFRERQGNCLKGARCLWRHYSFAHGADYPTNYISITLLSRLERLHRTTYSRAALPYSSSANQSTPSAHSAAPSTSPLYPYPVYGTSPSAYGSASSGSSSAIFSPMTSTAAPPIGTPIYPTSSAPAYYGSGYDPYSVASLRSGSRARRRRRSGRSRRYSPRADSESTEKVHEEYWKKLIAERAKVASLNEAEEDEDRKDEMDAVDCSLIDEAKVKQLLRDNYDVCWDYNGASGCERSDCRWRHEHLEMAVEWAERPFILSVDHPTRMGFVVSVRIVPMVKAHPMSSKSGERMVDAFDKEKEKSKRKTEIKLMMKMKKKIMSKQTR